MPVQWQNLDFPFQGGLNEAVAEEVMPAGMLQTAKNVRQRKSGELGPRYGYTDLGGTVSGPSGNTYLLNDVNSIHSRSGNHLIAYGDADDDGTVEDKAGAGLFEYSSTRSQWQRIGYGAPCSLDINTKAPAINGQADQFVGGYAHYGSSGVPAYYVYVYQYDFSGSTDWEVRIYDANGVYVAPKNTTETSSGGTGRSNVIAASANGDADYIRCASVVDGTDNWFYIFWVRNSTGAVNYMQIDMDTPELYGVINTLNSGGTDVTGLKTLRLENDATAFVMAWVEHNAGGADADDVVHVRKYDATSISSASWTRDVSISTLQDPGRLALLEDGSGNVHCFVRESSGNTLQHFELAVSDGTVSTAAASTGISLTAAITNITVALDEQYGSNMARIFIWEAGGGTASSDTVQHHGFNISTQTLDANLGGTFYHRGLVADAFTYNSRAYVWCNAFVDDSGDSSGTTTQGLYVLMTTRRRMQDDTSSNEVVIGMPVASCLFGRAVNTSTQNLELTQSYAMATGKFGCTARKLENTLGAPTEEAFAEIAVDFKPSPLKSVQLGSPLVVSGGLPMSVSEQSVELGFLQAPVIDVLTVVVGGGAMTAGDHSFRCVFAWIDGEGKTHRSQPSPAVTKTFAGNDRYTLSVHVPHLNSHKSGGIMSSLRLEVYISKAGGSIHYYDQTLAIGTGDVETVSDSNRNPGNDTTLGANAILYTDNGKELAAQVPPSTTRIARSPTRAYCIPDDDRYTVRTSKPYLGGFVTEWNTIDTLSLSSKKPLEAIAIMDGRAFAFSPDEIFVFNGEARNLSGTAPYSQVQKLGSDVGSVDPYVLVTQEGIIFRSKKGLYLLDRSLQTRYIGAGVEDSNSNNIYAAESLLDDREYRFIHGSDTSEAQAVASRPASTGLLVYDPDAGTWFRDDFTDALGAAGTLIDSAIWNDTYVMAARTGASSDTVRVVQEDSTVFQDWSTNFDRRIQTGWVRPAGLNGYVRMRRVGVFGKWVSTHTLGMDIYTKENSSTADESASFAITSNPTEYAYRSRLNNQKTNAIMIDITVSGASGEAFAWYGLTMEAGVKRGIRKLAPAATT